MELKNKFVSICNILAYQDVKNNFENVLFVKNTKYNIIKSFYNIFIIIVKYL